VNGLPVEVLQAARCDEGFVRRWRRIIARMHLIAWLSCRLLNLGGC